MKRIKLYFVGTGLNAARCVGGAESSTVRGVLDAHVFELPDGISPEDCMSKSPAQIMELGAKIIDPLMEPFDESLF